MRFAKDPDSELFYLFDFAALENGNGDSNWLDRNSSPVETINTATVFNVDSPGLTISATNIVNSNTSVQVKINGGTVGQTYRLTCRINTSTGQQEDRTATFKIKNK